MFRLIKIFFVSIVLFLVILTFFFIQYLNKNISLNKDYYLYINKGDSFNSVAKNLYNNGIINNKKIFVFTTRIISKNNIKIYSGEFLIKKDFKIKDVIDTILNNKVYYRSITFAEGLSTNSIIKILNKEENLVGELDPDNFEEGIYLPETYKYVKGDTKISILNRMKISMEEFINFVWDDREKNEYINNKYDLLKLASIVEKETNLDYERPIVASIFLNRLKKGMRLQTDPTVIYSFAFGNIDLERRIRKKDLENNIPYNTYKKFGLTPTPICNAGKKSILAVLHPAKTDYLYFVVDTKTGGHSFSKDYRTHRKNVKNYVDDMNKK